jgi:hypothetical protein
MTKSNKSLKLRLKQPRSAHDRSNGSFQSDGAAPEQFGAWSREDRVLVPKRSTVL